MLKSGTTVVVTLGASAADDAVARVDFGGAGLPMDMLEAPVIDGKATIANVAPGPVVVSALRGRELICRQTLDVPSDRSEVEVHCAAHKVMVSGVVKVGGRPAGSGTLMWVASAPDIPTGGITFAMGGVQQPHLFSLDAQQETTTVAADGHFEGPALLPGTWDVLWWPDSGRAVGPKRIDVGDALGPMILEYPGVSIDGVVLDAQRKPIKGAEVRDAGRRGFAITRDDGSFSLTGPEPGTWQIQARYLGQSSAVREVVVNKNDQTPFVELMLDSNDGRVRIAAGNGAMVFLETDKGGLELATGDATGVATFRLSAPFPQTLRVASFTDGRWTFGHWIAWEDATKAAVTLAHSETAGNVVLHTKGPTGAVIVTSVSGWRIDRLLQWLGSFLELTPENDIAIAGLPPGTYGVSVGNRQRTLSVEKGKTAEVAFE